MSTRSSGPCRRRSGGIGRARLGVGQEGPLQRAGVDAMLDGHFAPSQTVEFTLPHIAGGRLARWEGLQAETVQATEIEPFDYGFLAPHHLLIASERGERDDGETLVE